MKTLNDAIYVANILVARAWKQDQEFVHVDVVKNTSIIVVATSLIFKFKAKNKPLKMMCTPTQHISI